MKVVDKKLKNATTIPLLLSADELKSFRRTVRGIIRKDYNANMDAWPARTAHDYAPDARRAITEALINKWDEFFSDANAEGNEEFDETEIAEFLLPNFHTD
ncbi:hypothetical protein KJ359_007017 [Pestalotiopsis sp. 9143b]|nr:hypothetical protein KJ359_007017 [Pestalotiopsis sp. 9143b]